MEPSRRFRLRAALRVIVSDEAEETKGTTGNISTGGLFLVTDGKWPLNSILAVRIIYRYWDLKVNAKVIHTQPDGVGLQFVDPDDDFQAQIQAIIESLLADGAWYDERRQKLRTDVTGPVVWRFAEEEIESNLKNLSAQGAFIQAMIPSVTQGGSRTKLSVGEEVFMYFPSMQTSATGSTSMEAMGCRAKVVHKQEDGIGVEFFDQTPEVQDAIHNILNQGAGVSRTDMMPRSPATPSETGSSTSDSPETTKAPRKTARKTAKKKTAKKKPVKKKTAKKKTGKKSTAKKKKPAKSAKPKKAAKKKSTKKVKKT